jgi:hypothetical protein
MATVYLAQDLKHERDVAVRSPRDRSPRLLRPGLDGLS